MPANQLEIEWGDHAEARFALWADGHGPPSQSTRMYAEPGRPGHFALRLIGMADGSYWIDVWARGFPGVRVKFLLKTTAGVQLCEKLHEGPIPEPEAEAKKPAGPSPGVDVEYSNEQWNGVLAVSAKDAAKPAPAGLAKAASEPPPPAPAPVPAPPPSPPPPLRAGRAIELDD